ncbi:cell cycle progression protein 1-like [Phycodurus eques]|uniref:cell cycle progression protein 1-like n=1 Tax=Phycodurus eques TaxID=693459 RepID=UPI002ACEB4E8|nr:cell cycle progression protein 1-like [Phycodurus eques]
MSNTSSDTESSCGWSIVSMEGSDFETLVADATGLHGADDQERPAVVEPELQDSQDSASASGCNNDKVEGSLDNGLGEQTMDETLCVSEERTSHGNLSATWSPLPVQMEPRQAGADDAAVSEHVAVLSSSDHSDIVTLKELREDECDEGLYLGTSSSSRYAFTAAEPVLPAQLPPAATNSSSSEGEVTPNVVVRRRRLRRNTINNATESCEEEMTMESEEEDEEEEEKQQAEQTGDRPATLTMRGQGSGTLNSCILLALVIALSMGFGHFYGTVHKQERQKTVDEVRENELNSLMDVLQYHIKSDNLSLDELDEQMLTSLFIQAVKKMNKENKELSIQRGRGRKKLRKQRSNIQDLAAKAAAPDVLLSENQRLKEELAGEKKLLSENQRLEGAKKLLSENQRLKDKLQGEKKLLFENQRLKDKLEGEKKVLSENQRLKDELEGEKKLLSENQRLKDELEGQKKLLSENQRLKDKLEGEKKLLSENQRLKDELEGEKKLLSENQRLKDELAGEKKLLSENQRLKDELEGEKKLLSENQRLRNELEGEKELKKKLDKERKLTYEAAAQEFQVRLRKLEERLGFEQQRSNLWERLYLETKEDRAKGDTEPKQTKARACTSGTVKCTFDAVKNSTKEFVHHHKEQIKKAKEAVKENLRKFSASVKSTFRHFKVSASTFINKMKREGTKFDEEDKYKGKKGHPQQDANTRKSGSTVHKERGQSTNPKGCRGVFDCAYHESMSVFNKAVQPIRADEFHQLLWSYLQREVHNFHHWKELESFIKGFFHNGLFIHDHILFSDFVSRLEHYLVNMPEYHGLQNDAFGDIDDFIYRHLFGKAYAKSSGPSGPLERPD